MPATQSRSVPFLRQSGYVERSDWMCLLVAWIKAPLSPCVDVGPWVIFSNRRIFLFLFFFSLSLLYLWFGKDLAFLWGRNPDWWVCFAGRIKCETAPSLDG